MTTPSYGSPYGGYAGPAEVQSLKSLLSAARVVALIFLILWLVFGGVGLILFFFAAGFFFVFFVVTFLLWFEAKEIEGLVDRGQYAAGKEKTLIWAIVGIIFGGFVPGLLLLVAYFRFDPLINAQHAQMGLAMPGAPYTGYGMGPGSARPTPSAAPTMGSSPAPLTTYPPTPAPPSTPPMSTCPRCGRQIIWVAQYGRWYCYGEQTYL